MRFYFKFAITIFWGILFSIFLFPKISEATTFAKVTVGAVLHHANGNYESFRDVKIEIYSSKDNNYKWAWVSTCYGCRTGSVIKNGAVWQTYPNATIVTHYTTKDGTGSGWGDALDADRDGDGKEDYKFSCGASGTSCSVDYGDCNPFVFRATPPSGYYGGYWFGYAAKYSDPGWTGNRTYFTSKVRGTATISVNLANDSRTYIRFDFQENRPPQATQDSPSNNTEFSGCTTENILLKVKVTDPDNDKVKGKVVVQNLDTGDSTDFKNLDGANEWGWKAKDSWVASGSVFGFNLSSVPAFKTSDGKIKPGKYEWKVRGVDEYGSYSDLSGPWYFTVEAPPQGSCSISGPDSGCTGASLTFTADPNCTSGTRGNGQWYVNNSPISGATGTSLTYTFNSAGTYIVKYVFPCTSGGCTKSFECSKTVTIYAPQGTCSISGPASGCTGTSLTFTANPSCSSGTRGSGQWYVDGVVIGGATGTSLDYTFTSAGTYTVKYVFPCTSGGCTKSFECSKTVTIYAPQGTCSISGLASGCTGTSLTFTANPSCTSGTPGTGQWYIIDNINNDEVAVGGATGTSLDYTFTSAGTYTVKYVFTCNCGSSARLFECTKNVQIYNLQGTCLITYDPKDDLRPGTKVTFTANPSCREDGVSVSETGTWRIYSVNNGSRKLIYSVSNNNRSLEYIFQTPGEYLVTYSFDCSMDNCTTVTNSCSVQLNVRSSWQYFWREIAP